MVRSGVLARALANARQATGLSQAQFAAILDLEEATIRAWESGARPVQPDQLDAVARLFGLEVTQFLTADLSKSPSSLLYRSMAGGPTIEHFTGAHLAQQLGEFMRCARIAAECDQLAGAVAPLAWLDDLSPVPLPADSRVPHDAEKLARRVRDRLGLGDGPIPSMKALLRRLGVALFFVEPGILDTSIDAACMLNPRPAILVNVLEGGAKWWHTRMSLAHEIAHLCFDSDVLGAPRRFFLFSPTERSNRAWHLADRFEALEQRARAFAAYFLAPPSAVRALISPSEAATPAALYRLARHFGVGHETAANVLTNVFELSDDQRSTLISAKRVELSPEHPDRVDSPCLRDAEFIARVLRVLRDGKIDEIRARRWLGVGAHEPLPKGHGLLRRHRAPVVSPVDRARQRIEFLIRRTLKDLTLHIGQIEKLPAAKLRVGVLRSKGHEDEELVGHVVLDADDLRVLDTTGSVLAALACP